MLIIREPQFKVIHRKRSRVFAERLAEHLKKYFPEECAAMPDTDLVEIIDHGKTRALHYDFRSEKDVCKYLNLMFTFGRDFDRDPAFPWAAELLNTKPRLPSISKMGVLYDRALQEAESLDRPGLFREDAVRAALSDA